MKVMIENKGYIPQKAHPDDAGFDLRTPVPFILRGRQTVDVNTSVCVRIPEGYFGLICNKSGLAFRDGIRTETGIVDSGYTGPIHVLLTNFGNEDKHFDAGDKVSQLVVVQIHPDNKMELVDEMPSTERGENGFGSSGR